MLAAIRVGGSSAAGAAVHKKTSSDSNAIITMPSQKGGGGCDGAAIGIDNKQGAKAGKKQKKIARPMNSFMVFAQETRKALREKYPQTDNKEISKMLGQKWKSLTAAQKEEYAKQAQAIAEQHKRDHPDWKFVRAPPRKGRGKAAKAAVITTTTTTTATPNVTDGQGGNDVDAQSRYIRRHKQNGSRNIKREPPQLLPIDRSSPPPLASAAEAIKNAELQFAELQAEERKLVQRQQQIQAATEAEKPPPPTYVAPPSINQQGTTTTTFEDSSNPQISGSSAPPYPTSLEAVVAMIAD